MRLALISPLGFLLFVAVALAKAQVITARITDAVDFGMQVTAGGALKVTIAGSAFLIDSFFSEPREPKGVWNTFGETLPKSTAWSVTVDRSNSQAPRVTGSGRFYRIERTYARKSNRIEVADKITITHTEALGISIRHRLQLGSHRVADLRLGGYNVSEGKGMCGLSNLGNPTLFVKAESAGLGMLPLDDVFRVHAVLYNRAVVSPASCRVSSPPTVELTDANFGQDGGHTYTLRWAIYPIPRDWDYFAFINAVRRSLDANFTTDGSAIFFYPHSQFLNRAGYQGNWRQWDHAVMRKFLQDQGIRYVLSGIPTKADGRLAHGSAFVYEAASDSEQFLKDLVQKVHEADAAVKVLAYLHPFISTEMGAEAKYHQNRIVDKRGAQVVYPHSDRLPLFYGTRTNTYGKELEKYVDKVMKVLGADGIYIDESSWSVVRNNYDGAWDGVSVEIDPVTFQLRRKIASVPLITLAQRVALIRKVKQLGGVIVANVPPLTETMAKERIVHFSETGALSHLYRTQLHSPVGLNKGDGQAKDPDATVTIGSDVARNVVAHLDYGALSYFYGLPYARGAVPNPMQQMFPLTPLEINSGYIIGKERIVTKRSGTFGWHSADAFRVFIYDADGHQKTQYAVPAADGRPTSVTVDLSPGQIAIIVKAQFVRQ